MFKMKGNAQSCNLGGFCFELPNCIEFTSVRNECYIVCSQMAATYDMKWLKIIELFLTVIIYNQ